MAQYSSQRASKRLQYRFETATNGQGASRGKRFYFRDSAKSAGAQRGAPDGPRSGVAHVDGKCPVLPSGVPGTHGAVAAGGSDRLGRHREERMGGGGIIRRPRRTKRFLFETVPEVRAHSAAHPMGRRLATGLPHLASTTTIPWLDTLPWAGASSSRIKKL